MFGVYYDKNLEGRFRLETSRQKTMSLARPYHRKQGGGVSECASKAQ